MMSYWKNKRQIVIAMALLVVTAAPAFCQFDLSGEWNPRQHHDVVNRGIGPTLGDYTGLPINDAARMRGDSWSASLMTLPERQCIPYSADYAWLGPAALRIWKDVDPETQQLTAYRMHTYWQSAERTIWMDNRPHPSDFSPHSWQGFSTGKWEGDMLTVTTTHLKTAWVQRNGIFRSDRATLTEHMVRHGDYLTVMIIVNDPAYLTEPFVRSADFVYDPRQTIAPYPCDPVTEIVRPKGSVPHYLPGTNPFLNEPMQYFGVPLPAARGGAETMYPDYQLTMKNAKTEAPAPRPGATASVNALPETRSSAANLQVLPVQGNLYLVAGAGANVALQVGNDGVLMVDDGLAPYADQIFAEITRLSRKPLRYIVNTSADADHTGGNAALAKRGYSLVGGNMVVNVGENAKSSAAILAHENVSARMGSADAGNGTPVPFGALPTDSYFPSQKDIYVNGEAVQLIHPPAAHTDGDTVVFFRRSDVVVAGDIFSADRYPEIDLARGGSVQGILDGLNFLLDLTVPVVRQEGGTLVIPGHGRICDEADVVEYRDMVTIVRDRVLDMARKGMTMEQVKASRPTLDYDPLYAPNQAAADRFVEAVYRSLDHGVNRGVQSAAK
ncbi:MAG: MBL fold metallo-hydrolase [Bryobacteraceae bacterium]